ncbi:DNA polymerase III subunit gamma/tau [Olsenella sp. YH-ols2223]|uniref:DNA-directed DNA polymerase n=1 Tax=Olsenella absiana TaxID=3115222 RepID=A0ABU7RA95_9ACTN
MESLYRKYRPQTFDEVVGQAHVVSTLEHAVLEGRTSHAYLFCGPRGTGKTTMARLLAKALECEKGPGQLPDGTCERCRLIAEGDHPDVYELDAASRTGVDNVREEIISRVGFAPVRGRFKVYIIDEVHMLTTAAFNALLKTLEEPPSHVVFVLCTTDPQKIPATILSRVQRFDFHPLGTDEMRAHLVHVCEQEGFTYDDDAIDAVVRHARGGMRDALSTLEQLSVFGDGTVSSEAAQDMLGSVSASSLEKVVRSMAGRDVAALFEEVGALVEQGRDLLQFVRELSARLRDVYVASAVGASERVLPGAADEVAELADEARAFGSTDRVARVLSVLGDVSNEMRTATNQRLALEVAFTRVARPEADLTLDSLAERVAELEATVARLAAGAPVATAAAQAPAPEVTAPASVAPVQAPVAPAPAAPSPAAAPAVPVPSARPAVAATPAVAAAPAVASAPASAASPRVRPVEPARPAAPRAQAPAAARPSRPAPRPQAPAAATPTPAPAPVAAAPSAAGAVTDAGELQRLWKQTVDTLLRKIPSRGSLLMSSTILADDGVKLLVSLPKGSTFAMKMLERTDVSSAIAPYVAQVFGGPRHLAFAEPSLAATRIAHADRARAAQAPAPSQAPASRAPKAPVQAPAPAGPAPVPPVQARPAQAAPEPPAEGLPWDPAPAAVRPPVPAATPAPFEEPPYEQVPYDDLSAVSYDEAFQDDVAAPAPAAPATPPAPVAPAPKAAPVSAPAPAPASAPAPEAPAAAPSFSAPAAPDGAPGAGDVVPAAALDDVPDELRGILENAFEVFGAGVKARTEPAQPAAKGYDSDAASEGADAGGEG